MSDWKKCPRCGAAFEEEEADWGRYSRDEGGGYFMRCPNCGSDEDLRDYHPTRAERELLAESGRYGLDIDPAELERARDEDDD